MAAGAAWPVAYTFSSRILQNGAPTRDGPMRHDSTGALLWRTCIQHEVCVGSATRRLSILVLPETQRATLKLADVR